MEDIQKGWERREKTDVASTSTAETQTVAHTTKFPLFSLSSGWEAHAEIFLEGARGNGGYRLTNASR